MITDANTYGLTQDEFNALESLIDRRKVEGVLMCIADICVSKSEHIESNWQDRALAKSWDKVQHIVRTASVKVHQEERGR